FPAYQLPATAARLMAVINVGEPAMVPFAMPSPLTIAEVEKIAALASLELEASELDAFARQLGDILAYAEQVQQVDTAGVPPTAYMAPRREADRPDEIIASLDRDEA